MMPSFYPDMPPRQMLPTPPDYYNFPPIASIDVRQLPAPQVPQYSTQRRGYELGAAKMPERLSQYPRCGSSLEGFPTLAHENQRHRLSDYTTSQQFSNAYNTVPNAPLLPPMRIPQQAPDDYSQRVRVKRERTHDEVKEEKVMGGVAAHLDYEMDEMVDFVSETAEGIFNIYCSKICLADIDISRSVADSNTPVLPDFRKFVSQMLCSTRLPSSTILLGLHYLAARLTRLSTEGNFQYANGSLYLILTTALILGSKFLDDNTFQNRSWSEVSNISVADLNTLEMDWLLAINFRLHINPADSLGFGLWSQQWQKYQINRANKLESLVHSLEHTHLGDDQRHTQGFPRQRGLLENRDTPSYAGEPVLNGFPDSSRWMTPQYNLWSPWRSQTDSSPPSAPETGPTTPEWYQTQAGYGFDSAPHQAYYTSKVNAPVQVAGINAPQSHYHQSYGHIHNLYGPGSSCPYGYCMPNQEKFITASTFGPPCIIGQA